MNKSGQLQVISIFVQVVLGILFWATGFAGLINEFSMNAITTNNLTGLVAFFIAYMNLWIFLGFMLLISIASVVGSGDSA